ncbi:legumain [Nephila pilipes]|uniref:Legumain n=1 Tax=Nephila pilipes TaxID=299642 RepID=A0A8X6TVW8_NEPPI|nr:legumain [Nephila pilipes]
MANYGQFLLQVRIPGGIIDINGPNDHVFIYFADHGLPGAIGFPSEELSATQLNKTISYMYEKKMYGKMVIYLEACESGSMFENILPRNINVYATTAANGEESSYACYHDEKLNTYLGDYYSVNWLEDSDKKILAQETLHQQFEIVKSKTNRSHVQQYGDLKMGHLHLSEFQGRKNSEPIILPEVEIDLVRSRDVPTEIVKRKYMSSNSVDQKAILLKKLYKMLRNRQYLFEKMSNIVTEIFDDQEQETDVKENYYELRNFECYDEIREYFNEECFSLSKNEYALSFMYILVNLCEKGIPPELSMMAMERVCDHPSVYGII